MHFFAAESEHLSLPYLPLTAGKNEVDIYGPSNATLPLTLEVNIP